MYVLNYFRRDKSRFGRKLYCSCSGTFSFQPWSRQKYWKSAGKVLPLLLRQPQSIDHIEQSAHSHPHTPARKHTVITECTHINHTSHAYHPLTQHHMAFTQLLGTENRRTSVKRSQKEERRTWESKSRTWKEKTLQSILCKSLDTKGTYQN